MKRNFFATVLLLLLLISIVLIPAYAVDESRSYLFELSVDGKQTKEVETGDIITIVFHLVRSDADEAYPMYAMQNEIRYDSEFFELVSNGEILANGIQSTDIAMRDSYREFYMNYLSFGGGEQWKSRSLVGSFQLKVIGTTGVARITSNDYLVSKQDGSDSYFCEANELTVKLSDECVVRYESNGGSKIKEKLAAYGSTLKRPAPPTKEGLYFAGWYKDIDLTEQWNFAEDTVACNMTLYAKWSDVQVEAEMYGATENSAILIAAGVAVGIAIWLIIKKKHQE